jgi:hypothetical protein
MLELADVERPGMPGLVDDVAAVGADQAVEAGIDRLEAVFLQVPIWLVAHLRQLAVAAHVVRRAAAGADPIGFAGASSGSEIVARHGRGQPRHAALPVGEPAGRVVPVRHAAGQPAGALDPIAEGVRPARRRSVGFARSAAIPAGDRLAAALTPPAAFRPGSRPGTPARRRRSPRRPRVDAELDRAAFSASTPRLVELRDRG